MSDNLPPDEIERRLALFLSIPAEVWMDVLKLCSRRVLVQNIAPTCYRLKEISNKNVKNIHLIKNAQEFYDELEVDAPEANSQLRDLAANKCQLAGQFHLTKLRVSNGKSKDVLRHSLDLVQGCKLLIETNEHSENDKTVFLDECLEIVESTKPVTIRIDQLGKDDLNQDHTFWLHPAVQKCGRVLFNVWARQSDPDVMKTYLAIAHWLHHRPNSDGNGADQQAARCMVLRDIDDHNHIDWLLNRCSEKLQQSQQPTDRRPFVLSFKIFRPGWTGFDQFQRVANTTTGEVLTLDWLDDAEEDPTYRLRRCLAEEEANGPELYAAMFKRSRGYDKFEIADKRTPTVIIDQGRMIDE